MADPYAGVASPADPYAGVASPATDPYAGVASHAPAQSQPSGPVQLFKPTTDSPGLVESAIDYMDDTIKGPVGRYIGREISSDVAPFTAMQQHSSELLKQGPDFNPLDWVGSTVQGGEDLFNAALSPATAVFHAAVAHPLAEMVSRSGVPIYQGADKLGTPALSQPQAEQQLEGDFMTSMGGIGEAGAGGRAAALLDAAQGAKTHFDVAQSLSGTGAPVAPFVSDLFANRGMDTKPSDTPGQSRIQPMTQDHIALNAADHTQLQQLMQTGDVDDIKNFFQGRQGPQPSWSSVNRFVEQRDNPNFTNEPRPVQNPQAAGGGDFNYNDQYNALAESQWRESNRQAVEQHVQDATSSWKNAPDINVVHGPEDIADPQLRASVLADEAKGVAQGQGRALGVRADDGSVHIFSGRVPDEATANSILYHEALGHHGLSTIFQDNLTKMMTTLADRNVGQFGRLVDQRQTATGEARGLAAEEVLAHASQNGQMHKTWQGALDGVIRRTGERMGIKTMKYTDAEVNNILAMAHDAVINGKPDAASNGFRGALKPGGNKFMFTGPHAEEFDPEHATAFTPSDEVRRNEISDRGAVLHDIPEGHSKLGDVLDHPALYRNYPHLKDLDVYKGDMADEGLAGSHGAYDSDTKQILVHNGDLEGNSEKSVVLHEIQHAIQDHEGLLPETGPDQGTSYMSKEDYDADPREKEAVATEHRQFLSDDQRAKFAPNKFMRTDELGRELQDPEDLNMVDRLKADPRYWQDPEYRANVNELARAHMSGSDIAGRRSLTSGSKFITERQLRNSPATQPGYQHNYDDIESIAQHVEDHYTATVMSRDEIRQQALENGIKTNIGPHNSGEVSVRLAKLGYAAQYTSDLARTLLDKLDTPDWKPEDHIQLAKIIAQRDALVTKYKAQTNEVGRALQVAKMFQGYTNSNLSEIMSQLRASESGLAELADPTNPNSLKFARQLKEALAGNANPKGAAALMTGVVKPYWEQYLTTFHMNAMLSALSTHVKAPVDMMTGIGRNVIEKGVALPAGQVRHMLQGMGYNVKQGVEFGEFAAHIAGLVSSVTDMEVYKAMLHAAHTGESSYVLKGQAPTPTQFTNQFGAVSNPRIPGVSIPTDLIGAQDTVFRSWEMNGQLKTIAWREARADLGNKATTSDVWTLMQHKAANPTQSMLAEAFDETQRTLLLNNNKLNTMINKARTYRPGMTAGERTGAFIASNLAPFIRVESNNLMNRIVQRSPLGFLDGYTRAQLKMGGARGDIAMSKILYGTVLLGMYWNMAGPKDNPLTGAGPDSVDKYKERLASGWRPDAVHENGQYNTGGQLGMSINPFDVHNKTAQLVASARQAWDAGAQPGNKVGSLLLAVGSVFSNLAGMSWISDFKPAVDAALAKGQSAPAAVASAGGGIASTWVPNALNQAGRLTDPNERDTTSPDNPILGRIGNEMAQNIPGLRGNLPIKYSVYGDPLANGASITGVHTIIPGLSGNGTTETQDPAERELDRLSSITSSAIVTPVLHSISADPNDSTQGKIALNPHQFEDYQRMAGRSIVHYVQQDMDDGTWSQMSDAERVQEVRDIESDSKKAAAAAIREQLR